MVFVYGNMFGLFFSLFAILAGYNYFETGKIKYIFYSLFGITLAMMFKSNYLIIFVAMLLFVLFDVVLNKRYQSIILVILLIPTYFASSWIPCQMIHSITGIELGKGIPMTAYIEMGLQDSQIVQDGLIVITGMFIQIMEVIVKKQVNKLKKI